MANDNRALISITHLNKKIKIMQPTMFWTISQIVWAHWEQTVCRPISMLWALGYLANLQRKNYANSHTQSHTQIWKKKKKVILQIA